VMEASAAASAATSGLASARFTRTKVLEYPPEREVLGETPRIGVFVCHCGINIGGVVDIYLPDFKYGNDQDAISFSGVDDYVRHAATALREMVRQVGDTLEIENGLAMRGIIIRHLVIPGKVESSLEVLAHLPMKN
ncbi:MAG: hypothetical protein SVM79_03280, partial [Chloroflexota bacterium]|nr:hypothetical protein [Chloroflexota bacterium]